MSRDHYDRGVRDGLNDSRAGNPSKGALEDVLFGVTEEELEERRDYEQGRQHGIQQRKD